MNIFLFAPGLLYLLLEATGFKGAVKHIALCAAVQLALGAPFLATNPYAYLQKAFGGFGDLQQKWSVNWKFLPPTVFHSRYFVAALILAHLAALALLASRRWAPGGLSSAFARWRSDAPRGQLGGARVLYVLFTSNLVGVVFSRSLHFQFLAWYWHALPLILWGSDSLPLPAKAAAIVGIEYAYSYGLDKATGSSTALSSVVLQIAHLLTLYAAWTATANPQEFVITPPAAAAKAGASGATSVPPGSGREKRRSRDRVSPAAPRRSDKVD